MKKCFSGLFFIVLFGFYNVAGQVDKEQSIYRDSSVYDVSFYGINLEVSSNSTYLSGFTIINGKVLNQPLSKFYVELSDTLTVDSIVFNQKNTSFQHHSGWLSASLKLPVNPGNFFSVKIYYHGVAKSSNPLGGIGTSYLYGSNILFTSSEPFYAADYFPCKQLLTDKADSVFLYITVPKGQIVAANGILKSTINLSGDKTSYHWESHYPTAFYLIAFSVSDFYQYNYKFYDENYGDSISFQNYLYYDTSFIHQSKVILDKTVDLIKFYEKLTGVPYPFRKEKYGHVTAPIGGGMENQTLTILDEINFDLIAHELGHSWFGDMVTCSDWQNIWVNEGFASYFEYLAYEKFYPDEAKNWLYEAMNFALKDPTGSVYIPDDVKWSDYRIFSYAFTYKKGGLLLHMLRSEINNDSIFFTIYKNYLTEFAYSTASANDFKNIAEQVTGNNFEKFFNQWYYGSGYPTVNVSCTIKYDSLFVDVHNPTQASDNTSYYFHLNLLAYLAHGKDSLIRIMVNDTIIHYKTKLSYNIESIDINPNFNIIGIFNISPTIYLQVENLMAFPNPFTDSTTLRFSDVSSVFKVELFDVKGSLIKEWTNVRKELKIEPGLLKPGTYLVRANSEGNQFSVKIVKK